MNFLSLPKVHPMMVRRFSFPKDEPTIHGSGTFVFAVDFLAEDVGLADSRLDYDEDVVDCSNRMFQLTNEILMTGLRFPPFTIFNSRRWRNYRTGPQIDDYPDHTKPLLFIGNPLGIVTGPDGALEVYRNSEYIVKSGVELGY